MHGCKNISRLSHCETGSFLGKVLQLSLHPGRRVRPGHMAWVQEQLQHLPAEVPGRLSGENHPIHPPIVMVFPGHCPGISSIFPTVKR